MSTRAGELAFWVMIAGFALLVLAAVALVFGLPFWLGLWLYYTQGNSAVPPTWMLWIDGAWFLALAFSIARIARRRRAETRAIQREVMERHRQATANRTPPSPSKDPGSLL